MNSKKLSKNRKKHDNFQNYRHLTKKRRRVPILPTRYAVLQNFVQSTNTNIVTYLSSIPLTHRKYAVVKRIALYYI